jgi:hypothetical protein
MRVFCTERYAPREARGELALDAVLDLLDPGLALLLAGDLQRDDQLGRGGVEHGLVDVVLVVRERREGGGRLGGGGGHLGLRAHQLRDERLGRLEALGHDLLGRGGGALFLDEVPGTLGRLGLDHHDRDVLRTVGRGDDTAGDDHVEDGALELGVAREGDPLAVDERDAHATDGAGERQTRELGGQRRGVDGHDVVGVVGVQRHDRDDDLDLVAQALDEARAQRAVDEAAGQDRLGGGATLTTEERTGDLAGGVAALFHVDRQREEVELVLRGLAGGGGAQQEGLAVEVDRGGTGGLLGEATRFEADGAGAERTVVDDGFGGSDFGTLQGFLLQVAVRMCDTRAPRPSIEAHGSRSFRRPLPRTGATLRGVRVSLPRVRLERAAGVVPRVRDHPCRQAPDQVSGGCRDAR